MRVMRALGLAFVAGCCGVAGAQSIYTCVDSKGRKLTADRPIVECLDRTQQELGRSGLVKRELGPSLTAYEEAAQDKKEKLAAEMRAREAEGKRRDRALLLRYPTLAVHEKERAAALAQLDGIVQTSTKRVAELAVKRKAIATELEFYAKDPAKVPGPLKQRLEENDASLSVQQHFMLDQQRERKRISQRFDDELLRLKQLWP